MQKTRLLVFIPTYNEKDNVRLLYEEIKKVVDADILFCDDSSRDGTGDILDAIAQEDSTVHVLHRPRRMGLGTAHVQAFIFARKHHYQYLVTMDADFTHHPSYIPALLEHKDRADIVIGSRYVDGGAMHNWSGVRLPFTYFWRNAIKYGLGMKYDCTGAFRLYCVEKLNPELYLNFRSRGFSFCIESLFHLHYAGLKITEIPIQAYNRLHGSSKLSGAIMREGAATFLRLLFSKKRRSQ